MSFLIANSFYLWQFVCSLLWWIFVYGSKKIPLYKICSGSVCTRPSWLPKSILLWLHEFKAEIFLSTLPTLLLAGLTSIRLPSVISVTLYHLLETSVTGRHGEYPLLYNIWAFLLPEPYASAISFGKSSIFDS